MSSAKDLKAIEELIVLIGGKNNIISVSHCLTRLR
ncbi:PTS transporter subunit EIIB, partial [Providencia stuartii]